MSRRAHEYTLASTSRSTVKLERTALRRNCVELVSLQRGMLHQASAPRLVYCSAWELTPASTLFQAQAGSRQTYFGPGASGLRAPGGEPHQPRRRRRRKGDGSARASRRLLRCPARSGPRGGGQARRARPRPLRVIRLHVPSRTGVPRAGCAPLQLTSVTRHKFQWLVRSRSGSAGLSPHQGCAAPRSMSSAALRRLASAATTPLARLTTTQAVHAGTKGRLVAEAAFLRRQLRKLLELLEGVPDRFGSLVGDA